MSEEEERVDDLCLILLFNLDAKLFQNMFQGSVLQQAFQCFIFWFMCIYRIYILLCVWVLGNTSFFMS